MEVPLRFRSLDAMRGIAALQVMFAHYLSAGQGWIDFGSPWVRFTPLRFLLQAHLAVIFFFVLSGFALAHSLLEEQRPSYLTFIARRFCRIYLPFAAAILISTILCMALRQDFVPGISDSLRVDWLDASPTAVARHFLMTGLRPDMQLDGVMWSLVHEMRVSLIIPALVALFLWRFWVGAMVVAATSLLALITATQIGLWNPWQGVSIFASGLQTLFYLFPFAVGIVVAIWRTRLTAMLRRHLLLAIALGGVMMLWRHFINSYGFSDWLVSLLAAGAILVALEFSAVDRALLSKPLQWFGRVSYSLYLVHLPILLALLHGLAGTTSVQVAVLTAIPCSFLAALLLNTFVEQPAARLGRSILIGRKASANLQVEGR